MGIHMRLRAALAAFLVLWATAALAQQTDVPVEPPIVLDEPAAVESHVEGEYGGVTPGKAPEAKPGKPPRKRKPPSKPTIMWVGFQALDAGSSRVFVQLSAPGTHSQAVAGDELVVTLPGFRLGKSNDRRAIDTRFFTTPVAEVSAKETRGKNRGVELRFKFKTAGTARQADARSEQAQDGHHYLYLDFPPPAGG